MRDFGGFERHECGDGLAVAGNRYELPLDGFVNKMGSPAFASLRPMVSICCSVLWS